MPNILIIDDELNQREILAGFFKKKNYSVDISGSGIEGIEKIKNKIFDLVLTDLKMPDKDGLEVLEEVKKINPEISVIIMTAFGTVENAVKAMKSGAYDYITKPIDLDEIELLVKRALERNRLISENRELINQLKEKYSFDEIISVSGKMQNVLNTAIRVAQSKATVLIRGESGTGKELIAKAIHYSSNRKNKPLVIVNCSALSENLLESELFGHEKGAFTGAITQKRGRFEIADGGTIFLDEIGDITLSTQVKLLRILQEQKFERVGGTETIEVDVRIITATNKNLEKLMEEGKFREDLYYRLNVVTIEIHSLKERKEEIIPLIEHFIKKFSSENNKKIDGVSKEALDILMKHNYPGNVRELKNIIERAIVLSSDNIITTESLPINLKTPKSELEIESNAKTLTEKVEKLEKKLIIEALEKTGRNQTKAAELLGLTERNLRYKLKKYEMK
jgi:two-component system NtrC family response regulator